MESISVGIVAAGLIGLAGLAIHQAWAEPAVDLGDPSPAFRVQTTSGEVVSSDSFAGRVVLLDFWTRTCVGCLAATPKINRLKSDFEKDGLIILSFHQDDEGGDALARTMRERAIRYAVANDDGTIAAAFGIYSFPSVILIDHAGTVRAIHRKMVTEQKLRHDVSELLEEAKTSAARSAHLPPSPRMPMVS